MIKARDFLADNDLAIRGAKGRFSREAIAFLIKSYKEGQRFSDWTPPAGTLPKPKPAPAPAPVQKIEPVKPKRIKPLDVSVYKPVRKENTLRIIDEFGVTINLDTCTNCIKSIRNCRCKTIVPPAYLNATEWSLVTR